MYETTRRIHSISNSLNEAWKTLNFSNVQKLESKYNSIYMDLSRQLRAGLIDCVWFDDCSQKFIWTRSLKNKDTIQITSFSRDNKNLIPNSDVQVESYKELLQNIKYGVTLHILSFDKQC
jgi:hypothetical protein